MKHAASISSQDQNPTLREYLSKYLQVKSPKSISSHHNLTTPIDTDIEKSINSKISSIKRLISKYVTEAKICLMINKELESLRQMVATAMYSKIGNQTTCFSKKSMTNRKNTLDPQFGYSMQTIKLQTLPVQILPAKALKKCKTVKNQQDIDGEVSFQKYKEVKIYKAYSKQYVTKILPANSNNSQNYWSVDSIEPPNQACPEQKVPQWLPPELDKKYSDDQQSIRQTKKSYASRNSFAQSKFFTSK